MIVDLILNRKDGEPYNAKDTYIYITEHNLYSIKSIQSQELSTEVPIKMFKTLFLNTLQMGAIILKL